MAERDPRIDALKRKYSGQAIPQWELDALKPEEPAPKRRKKAEPEPAPEPQPEEPDSGNSA